ncbi:MAG: FAD-dependent oxidoreductase [Candidatus Uhrbacteria bacterium]|nr:FAD-dependent oxidoreductase [Candidatus Uhrbacteria bacterium]
MPFQKLSHVDLDVLIIGGGIAGLWLLDDLRRAGYDALLVESTALGNGQTLAAQGFLHSGLKYALANRPGTFVDALVQMPRLWRDALAGRREPDLRNVSLRGECCYCWREDSFMGRLGLLGARIGLQVPLEVVPRDQRPEFMSSCPGMLYRIEEQVVDPASLLAVLAERSQERIVLGTVTRDAGCVVVTDSTGERSLIGQPRTIVLAAGEGNEALRELFGLSNNGVMRRLPLRFLTLTGDLPLLNGFCLSGAKAKVIITSQRSCPDEVVWQVASETVGTAGGCPLEEFESRVMAELKESLPWFQLPECAIRLNVVTRAEAATPDDSRAADIKILQEGNILTAWPTKLVLAPRLTEQVRLLLSKPSGSARVIPAVAQWQRPSVADYPWTK